MRSPRRKDEPLFGLRQIGFSLAQGLSVLIGVFAIYAWALQGPGGEAQARGAGFTTLIVGVLVLALTDSMSSGKVFARHRRIYWGIAGVVVLVIAVILMQPLSAAIFAVARPSTLLLAAALAAGVLSASWTAWARLLRRPTGRGQSNADRYPT